MSHVAWRGDESVLDVGCGNGQLTAELARQVPRGKVVGIDSSPEMIAHARQTYPLQSYPNLAFLQMDARALQLPDPFDVLFSNAALHWVDDHRAFLKGAAAALQSGGRLVVSCGGKGNASAVVGAVHSVMRLSAWRSFFRNLDKPYFFYSDADYRTWLPEAGFRPETVQLVERDAIHAERSAFAGWLRTTWMPYTQRVPGDLRERFIDAIVERYLKSNPPDSTGAIHVCMVRLELDAVRC